MAIMNMKKYLFRCDRSGVFYGELVEREGQIAKIKNARKVYYWTGAACLEQLCMEGTKSPNECKFTMVVDEIEVYDLIQLLPCTEQAIANIEGVKEWKIK
jgi:hypothetical protein